MTLVQSLRSDAEYAFGELMQAVDGLTQEQAWGKLPASSDEYLHTDGSVQGILLHTASSKRMYGSICFRDTELRWQDCAKEFEAFEPSWEKSLEFVHFAHKYWMESWAHLTDDRLEEIRPTNWKTDRSAREIIRIMNHHDAYHAGQIAMVRFAAMPSTTPPESQAEDIRQYCRDSKHW